MSRKVIVNSGLVPRVLVQNNRVACVSVLSARYMPRAGGTFTGPIAGNGAGLTHLNASNLASGTVPAGRLPPQPVAFHSLTRHESAASFLIIPYSGFAWTLTAIRQVQALSGGCTFTLLLNGLALHEPLELMAESIVHDLTGLDIQIASGDLLAGVVSEPEGGTVIAFSLVGQR